MSSNEELENYYTQPFQKLGNFENHAMITLLKIFGGLSILDAFRWVWDIHGLLPYSQLLLIGTASAVVLRVWKWFTLRQACTKVDVALTDEALIFRKEGAAPVEVAFTKDAARFRHQHLETLLETPNDAFILRHDHPMVEELFRRHPTLPWPPLPPSKWTLTLIALTAALWVILLFLWGLSNF